jgi:tRNA uridine 5-carbamoylmethylation protein Kti12
MEIKPKLKHYIILVGLPASGKSTLSQRLKKELDDSIVIEFD